MIYKIYLRYGLARLANLSYSILGRVVDNIINIVVLKNESVSLGVMKIHFHFEDILLNKFSQLKINVMLMTIAKTEHKRDLVFLEVMMMIFFRSVAA